MNPPFDLDGLLAWRAERDKMFRSHYASPIPEDHQFTALGFFDPNPDWVLTGRFIPAGGRIDIGSSTGGTSAYEVAGYVELEIHGEPHQLVVLHGEEGELFIPFRDATAGDTTYEGGRYVSVSRTDQDEATVDFNRAVNPYCAYDEEFSCPLPPTQNRLPFPVPAGELAYVP